MADNANLATVIAALTNSIAVLAPPPIPAAVFDPFAEDKPFDLSTRIGSKTFSEACAPLEQKWGGSVQNFPSFVVSLRLRAAEANWNAPAHHGIVKIGTNDILTDYHSVTDNETEALRPRLQGPSERIRATSKIPRQCLVALIF